MILAKSKTLQAKKKKKERKRKKTDIKATLKITFPISIINLYFLLLHLSSICNGQKKKSSYWEKEVK
jgi:Zn-dependent peptidase ImmA (M78 family)